MELGSFVRVAVRFPDGTTGVGTGYRLRQDRVLTAGHVVAGAVEIEVEGDEPGGQVIASPAEVLWRDDSDRDGLDAAILGCNPHEAAATAAAGLARGPLMADARWESRGRARAAVPGRSVFDSMVRLDGTAYTFVLHADRFEVTVEASVSEAEDWSGISGAPVFVDGRIYGVIVRAPKSFNGRRLHAVPMHRLVARRGFAEVVGLEPAAEASKLRRDVEALLMGERTAADHLADHHDLWRQAYDRGDTPELVAAICERSSVEQALVGVYEAHGALVSEHRETAARTLEEVLAHLAPLLYDRQLGDELVQGPGGVVLKVPVATSMMAEVVMARVEERATRFEPAKDSGSFLDPFASVAKFPDVGIDPTKARAFQQFVEHLALTFAAEEDRRLLQRPAQSRTDAERYAELAQIVNDELEWRAKPTVEGVRRYVLFDSRFASDHGQFLKRVQESLPALRLLELTGRDRAGERRLCRPLRDIFRRKAE